MKLLDNEKCNQCLGSGIAVFEDVGEFCSCSLGDKLAEWHDICGACDGMPKGDGYPPHAESYEYCVECENSRYVFRNSFQCQRCDNEGDLYLESGVEYGGQREVIWDDYCHCIHGLLSQMEEEGSVMSSDELKALHGEIKVKVDSLGENIHVPQVKQKGVTQ